MTPPDSSELFEVLGRNLLVSELSADAAWFRQGLVLLDADKRLGRSVYHREAIKGIQASGSFYPFSADRLRSIRYTTRTLIELGFALPSSVYGCPLERAAQICKHYNQGRLTRAQIKEILSSMRLYYRSKHIDFSLLKTEAGLNALKQTLDLDRFATPTP